MASDSDKLNGNKPLENLRQKEAFFSPVTVPKLKLNDGNEVPIIGLATRKLQTKCKQVISDAFKYGYRHLDCAEVDGNEKEIGDAIRDSIRNGLIKREDLFITSKVWNNHHTPQLVRRACENSLKNLNVAYLDSYIMHSPMAFLPGADFFPSDENGNILCSEESFLPTWHAMEKLVRLGLVKSLGLENFNIRQIIYLLENCRIKPTLLHVECHPYLNQQILIDFCDANEIVVVAKHCFGSPATIKRLHNKIPLIRNPKILEIARERKMTPSQVLIRYQIQRGNIVSAATFKKDQMKENISSIEFKLDSNDITEIDSLETGTRIYTFNDLKGHPNHPFEKDLF